MQQAVGHGADVDERAKVADGHHRAVVLLAHLDLVDVEGARGAHGGCSKKRGGGKDRAGERAESRPGRARRRAQHPAVGVGHCANAPAPLQLLPSVCSSRPLVLQLTPGAASLALLVGGALIVGGGLGCRLRLGGRCRAHHRAGGADGATVHTARGKWVGEGALRAGGVLQRARHQRRRRPRRQCGTTNVSWQLPAAISICRGRRRSAGGAVSATQPGMASPATHLRLCAPTTRAWASTDACRREAGERRWAAGLRKARSARLHALASLRTLRVAACMLTDFGVIKRAARCAAGAKRADGAGERSTAKQGQFVGRWLCLQGAAHNYPPATIVREAQSSTCVSAWRQLRAGGKRFRLARSALEALRRPAGPPHSRSCTLHIVVQAMSAPLRC